jgi:hypothetical protein
LSLYLAIVEQGCKLYSELKKKEMQPFERPMEVWVFYIPIILNNSECLQVAGTTFG